MSVPSIRIRRIAGFSAAPIAIVVAGLLVFQGSNAAFTAKTQNVGNNWATGTVTLTDDDSGAAMFQAANITPGQQGTKCIKVTSTSTAPGVVRVYQARTALNGLENYIVGTLEKGTGGSWASCTGFVSDDPPVANEPFAAYATSSYDFATGGLDWATTGTPGESKVYKLYWKFDTTGLTQAQVDALQGKSIATDFVWELQSN